MMKTRRKTAWASLWAALIALSGVLAPAPAHTAYAAQPEFLAQSPAADGSAAPSAVASPSATADPSDEIVYIGGGDDKIRVIDPTHVANEVQWVSPLTEFREVALGDVNNDGDMEIIGIRGDNPNGQVIVYDPVVASGAGSSAPKINNIPWAVLATIPVNFTPTLILAGDFDPNVPGDEFVTGGIRPNNPDEIFELDVYKNETATSAGKAWKVHVGPKYFEGIFSRGAVGNVIHESGEQYDEFAMINEDGGVLEAYSLANGFDNILTVGDQEKPFRDVTFARWSLGSPGDEIMATRSADLLVNLFYWEFQDDNLNEREMETVEPAFRRLTATDVNANGDDELYMLRDVPAGEDKARLASRNSGTDGIHEFDEALSDDNAYRALLSGDINGDGKGDVIIGSADNIRVYTNAARNSDDYDDYGVHTNKRSIVAGNLDAIGFVTGPEFVVDKSNVSASASVDTTADAVFYLSNSTTVDAIPYVITAEGDPSWLLVNGQNMADSPYQATGNTRPNNEGTPITLRFDATGLMPGTYRSRLHIDSSADVVNAPVDVVLTFVVKAAELFLAPGLITAGGDCSSTTGITATTAVAVTGLQGLEYSASVLDGLVAASAIRELNGPIVSASLSDDGLLELSGAHGESVSLAVGSAVRGAEAANSIAWPSGVDWVTASSADGVVPDTLTVTTTVASSMTDFSLAYVLLFGDVRAGQPPDNVRLVTVTRCSQMSMVPTVMNNAGPK